MNTLLNDAHTARGTGDIASALRLFHAAASAKHLSEQEQATANYMQAYLFATSRSYATEALGSDLRSPQQSNYTRAGELLRQISRTDFDPVAHGLPSIAGYDLFEIAESNPVVAEEILLNPYFSQCLTGQQLCLLGQSELSLAVAILNTPHLSERLSEIDLFRLAKEQPLAFEHAEEGIEYTELDDIGFTGTSFSTQAI